jgi:OmpA-OmpF porin, OOP family
MIWLSRPLPTWAVLVAAGVALAPGLARAQSADAPSVNLRGFAPAPDPRATLFLEPVATPGPGVFHAAGWVSYAYRPLVLRNAEDELVGKAIEHQVVYDQTLGIGIGQRVGVGLTMPFVVFQQSEDIGPVRSIFGGGLPPQQALGDLMLSGKFALVMPGEIGGFGLAAITRLTLPTGTQRGSLGEGAVTGEARLLAELGLAALSVQASAGVKVRPTNRSFGGATWGEELPWGAGIFVKPQILGVDAKGRWAFGVEAHGALPLAPSSPFTDATVTPAYAGGSLRFTPGALSLLFGAETALSRAAGAAPLRAVLSLGFTPRSHDKDHDGVDDDDDDCPSLAEDKDGFLDRDGCPELDNDDDGVLDADDKCPTQKEDQDGDRDDDGCLDPDSPKPKRGAAPAQTPGAAEAPAAVAPSDAKPADAKPADAKPADAKPADAAPADAKPGDPPKGKKGKPKGKPAGVKGKPKGKKKPAQ